MTKKDYDVIIIGAGAAGMMCAITSAQRGLSVLLLDKAERVGKKILISGGGRCNFTNLHIDSTVYLSPNPHFCKSALSRYTQWDIVELLQEHGLSYQEKTLGQLFCQQQSKAIVQMLIDIAHSYHVNIALNETIHNIDYQSPRYYVSTQKQTVSSRQLVIASGGPSIPKIGASSFALQVAKQFGIKNTPFSPALVPLTLPPSLLQQTRSLAGISHFVSIACRDAKFTENLLFTHRGLSGPAVLQISSYWQKGDVLTIDLCPQQDMHQALSLGKKQNPQQLLSQFLSQYLPQQFATLWVSWFFDNLPLQQFSDKALAQVANTLQQWQIQPNGSEGMKKAEVSRGGIHPDSLSSKTFECHHQRGLYFIGEAVDIIGWLGGYNFQWAWSSGWCCAQSLTR